MLHRKTVPSSREYNFPHRLADYFTFLFGNFPLYPENTRDSPTLFQNMFPKIRLTLLPRPEGQFQHDLGVRDFLQG